MVQARAGGAILIGQNAAYAQSPVLQEFFGEDGFLTFLFFATFSESYGLERSTPRIFLVYY
jgi:hypothetical protein